ncbi:MAG TPA: hypothetical protein VKM93_28725 [Terriglobia bacterium]|nr:hypothetical protein [Terriglobia bacterium]
MLDKLISYGLQYAGYLLQVLLLVVLTARGHWRRLVGVSLYVVLFVSIDSVARPCVLFRYGIASPQYRYVYWLSDVLLVLAAFVVVCIFFRRACAAEEKLWRHLRLLLGFVFALLACVSYFMIYSKFGDLWSRFITEFQQNTYFACLVLTTLLYIMMQRSEGRDEELAMLVCGMGILFAAPTAVLALYKLLPPSNFASALINHVDQVCMLGMLSTWWYAITKLPHGAIVRADVPVVARA